MHNPPPAGFPAMIECWCCARVENRRGNDIHESTKETELCSSCKEAGKCWSCRRCEEHCACTIEQLELASKNWETQGIPSIAARLGVRALIQRGRFAVPGMDGFSGRQKLPGKPNDEPRSYLYVLRGLARTRNGTTPIGMTPFEEVHFDVEVAMARARWVANDWEIECSPINPDALGIMGYIAAWDNFPNYPNKGQGIAGLAYACLSVSRVSYSIAEAQEDIGLTGLVKRFHGPEPLDTYDRLLEAARKVCKDSFNEVKYTAAGTTRPATIPESVKTLRIAIAEVEKAHKKAEEAEASGE